jgi:molybdate transport system substrate-binding protein
MTPRLRRALALSAAALALAGAGCGTTKTGGEDAADTKLTVYAAASMKTTFTALGKTFEASHPGKTVTFNFAGSQALAEQITQGAPADVFASANDANMKTVVDAGLASAAARQYATNRLTIAVPPDNPAKVAAFADLAKPGIRLVVCAPAVPCGAATVKIEQATGVDLKPVSEEQAVTDVLAKVQAGEADAGLVYVTDAKSAGGKVLGIDFPESAKAINNNSIVALKNGPMPGLAAEFVDLVFSPAGQQVLADAGFGKPAA